MSGLHTDKAEQDYENREEESNVEDINNHIKNEKIIIHQVLEVETKNMTFSLIYQKNDGTTAVKPFQVYTYKDLFLNITKFINDNCLYHDNILGIVEKYVPILANISEQTDYMED